MFHHSGFNSKTAAFKKTTTLQDSPPSKDPGHTNNNNGNALSEDECIKSSPYDDYDIAGNNVVNQRKKNCSLLEAKGLRYISTPLSSSSCAVSSSSFFSASPLSLFPPLFSSSAVPSNSSSCGSLHCSQFNNSSAPIPAAETSVGRGVRPEERNEATGFLKDSTLASSATAKQFSMTPTYRQFFQEILRIQCQKGQHKGFPLVVPKKTSKGSSASAWHSRKSKHMSPIGSQIKTFLNRLDYSDNHLAHRRPPHELKGEFSSSLSPSSGQTGSLLLVFMFYSRLYDMLKKGDFTQRSGVNPFFAPIDMDATTFSIREAMELATDFQLGQDTFRCTKRKIHRIWKSIICHLTKTSKNPFLMRLNVEGFLSFIIALAEVCMEHQYKHSWAATSFSDNNAVTPEFLESPLSISDRIERVREFLRMTELNSSMRVKSHLLDAYRDRHIWKLEETPNSADEVALRDWQRAQPIGRLLFFKSKPLDEKQDKQIKEWMYTYHVYPQPLLIWEPYAGPWIDMGTQLIGTHRSFRVELCNTSVSQIVRPSITIENAPFVRLRFKEGAFIFPSQNMIVSLDSAPICPGECHGTVVLRLIPANTYTDHIHRFQNRPGGDDDDNNDSEELNQHLSFTLKRPTATADSPAKPKRSKCTRKDLRDHDKKVDSSRIEGELQFRIPIYLKAISSAQSSELLRLPLAVQSSFHSNSQKGFDTSGCGAVRHDSSEEEMSANVKSHRNFNEGKNLSYPTPSNEDTLHPTSTLPSPTARWCLPTFDFPSSSLRISSSSPKLDSHFSSCIPPVMSKHDSGRSFLPLILSASSSSPADPLQGHVAATKEKAMPFTPVCKRQRLRDKHKARSTAQGQANSLRTNYSPEELKQVIDEQLVELRDAWALRTHLMKRYYPREECF